MNICIILTSNINGTDVRYDSNQNKNEKEKISLYVNKVRKWLECTKLKIVLIENSGYTFPELPENNERFEKITFTYKNIPAIDSHNLLYSKSKGYQEIYAIRYAFFNSQLLKSATHIIKITGRYFLPNFEEIINKSVNKNTLFIKQREENKCEIVGCKSNIFDYHFRYPPLDPYVEYHYSNQIKKYFTVNPQKKVSNRFILTLPKIDLDETTLTGHWNLKNGKRITPTKSYL